MKSLRPGPPPPLLHFSAPELSRLFSGDPLAPFRGCACVEELWGVGTPRCCCCFRLLVWKSSSCFAPLPRFVDAFLGHVARRLGTATRASWCRLEGRGGGGWWIDGSLGRSPSRISQ